MTETKLFKRNNIWIVRTFEYSPLLFELYPRTSVFWGASQGGIRRLIALGRVKINFFVKEVLIPIIGIGGQSPYLNSFFNSDLFIGQEIEEVFDAYVDLFEHVGVYDTDIRLAQQMFTTYLNIIATDMKLLPAEEVYCPFNSKVNSALVGNIFQTSKAFYFTVGSLLQETEAFLAGLNTDVQFDASFDIMNELADVFSNINDNKGIGVDG